MIGNTYIEPKSQKSFLKIFCYNNEVTRKVKPFNLMVLNTANLSNSFYGKTFLKGTVFSVLIYGVKHFLIGLRNALMDDCIFSIRNKLIHFSLPLNPVIH